MKTLIIGGDSFVARNFIKHSEVRQEFKVISRDKTDFKDEIILKDFFSIPGEVFQGVDNVFNCAGIVHRKNVTEETYKKINYELVSDMAGKAKKKGVIKFIQMSTISVYGKINHIDHNTLEEPDNIYGKTKYLADQRLLDLQNDQFSVVIIRSPMIYGAAAPGNMMKLIKFVDTGVPLPFKNTRNKRDYLYVKNLVHFIDRIISGDYSGKLLITDGDSVSTETIVKLIKSEMNKKNLIFSVPGFLRKILKRIQPELYWKLFEDLRIDSTLARKKLKTEISYDFISGLKSMIKDYLQSKEP